MLYTRRQLTNPAPTRFNACPNDYNRSRRAAKRLPKLFIRYDERLRVSACGALIILVNPILVWGPPATRLGFIGAPLSTALSFNVIALLTILYIAFLDPRKAWHPVTSNIFSNLGIVVRLGLAGVGQLASEWWAWELVGCESKPAEESYVDDH